jgi:hypothetical protein
MRRGPSPNPNSNLNPNANSNPKLACIGVTWTESVTVTGEEKKKNSYRAYLLVWGLIRSRGRKGPPEADVQGTLKTVTVTRTLTVTVTVTTNLMLYKDSNSFQ